MTLMSQNVHSNECFAQYSLACLQMAADGFTLEDTAKYVGCEYEQVEYVLEIARRCLGAANLEQSVAVAIKLGLIA